MPELPEVETTRRGIAQTFIGQRATAAICRTAQLRYPIPKDLEKHIAGQQLISVDRRGKYLLLHFEAGALLIHLGMSGSIRTVATGSSAQQHDHVDLVFGKITLRLRDPRRFGAVLWINNNPEKHPLLAKLGMEPLSELFTGTWLYENTRNRRTAIKPLIMNSAVLVGVGNIYASESLFRAHIDPRMPAYRLSKLRCERLVESIRTTLFDALAAGGSSIRNYVNSNGQNGAFQFCCDVYNREGEDCKTCATPIRSLRQGQRSTFYCPTCQRR